MLKVKLHSLEPIAIGGANISNKQYQWMKYRWEFMRDDPEYRTMYNEIVNTRKKAKLKAPLALLTYAMVTNEKIVRKLERERLRFQRLPYWQTEDGAIEFKFKDKFNLHFTFGIYGVLLNPEKSFEEIWAGEDGWDDFQKNSFRLSLHQDLKQTPITYSGTIGEYKPTSYTLTIHVDFEKVNSIDALKNKIIEDIDQGWQRYNKFCGHKKVKKQTDYDVILQVGRLKNKEKGITNMGIAKKMFPRDFNPNNENANPETAIRKISQYIKTYNGLINGGYKTMTYP